ncbi:MAG: sle [Frankiales bacterium]|nr:sle [Frankiales bacterium]
MTSSGTRAPDRRQRKSRAALQQALLRLIAVRPYDAVTIEDVTAEADVARATFYAHYKDKAALLLEVGSELISELAARVSREAAMSSGVYTGDAVYAIFEHASEHRHLYRLIISGEGGPAVRAAVLTTFEGAVNAAFARIAEEEDRTPRGPLALTSTAFTGALLRTIESWIDAGLPSAPGALTADFLLSQAGGLEWALGFGPGETRLAPTP